jgi:oligosaccharide repeat unit polymerase
VESKTFSREKSNWLVGLSNRFNTPTKAILHTWILWLLLYVFSPFHYTNDISLATVVFISFCLFSFIIGDLFAFLTRRKASSSQANVGLSESEIERQQRSAKLIERIAAVCAVLGIIGAFLIVFSKLLLSGIDFSSGISSARIGRASDILSGQAADSPIWIYPGLLAFPFGTCAFLLCLLEGERWSRYSQRVCKLAALSPVAVAVINGGRAGLLQFTAMVVAAFALRGYVSKTQWLDDFKVKSRLKIGKFLFLFIIAFLLYNIYIFESRREATGKEDFFLSLSDWEQNYGISPNPWVLDLVKSGFMGGGFVLNWMQTHFYFTSGPAIMSRIVDSGRNIGPFLGQYQVGILSPLLNRVFPSWYIGDQILSETGLIDVTGLIPSAWGMMLLDFGWTGTLIEAFVLGWFSRRVYDKAIFRGSIASKLMFCFVFASIVLSPVIAPLGFADSCFTFVSLICVCWLLDLTCRPAS